MRNLLQLIIRYHFFLLFLLLELLAFSLLVRYNHFQSASFNSLTTSVEGYILENMGGVREYLNLRKANQDLVMENIILRNQIDHLKRQSDNFTSTTGIPGIERQFLYTRADVIKNSTNKQFNFITINKGSLHHVSPEMAVISARGVVGVVFSVSRHFAVVLPALNRNFRLSAKLVKDNYFGSLTWPGDNTGTALLSDIPYHVDISVGDTIVTSGYSTIFPPGLPIGSIKEFSKEEGNFYDIIIDLFVDFGNLSTVYIIENFLLEEQQELEETTSDD